jgi:hypothetical protein
MRNSECGIRNLTAESAEPEKLEYWNDGMMANDRNQLNSFFFMHSGWMKKIR